MVVKTAVLKELEEAYQQSGNQLFVLYGRADSEKELLLKALVQNKKYFYYRARQASPEEQCRQMGAEIAEQFEVSLQKYTYQEYFNRVKSGGPSKLLIVMDEFQYITKKDAAFFDAVLKLKAKRLYPGPVMILLCSSAVSWVEQEMEKIVGEAARKIDRRIKITNLNFLEVVRALPEYPVAECIKVYGIIGGVPGYINRWNAKVDIRANICRLILSRNGYMHGAAEELIGASLRELSVYETILANIAAGHDKLNDIYRVTGFSRAKISVYMKSLSAFDIIQKVVSFETGGWDNAKKGIYRIRDNYVNFWFHFIYPHLSDLYMLGAEEFYDRHIAPGLNAYLNRYFTEVCMEYLGLLGVVGKLPLRIKKMGTWIGKEGNIDIIAQNEVRQNMVGICNWAKPELTVEMCEALFSNMERAKIKAEYYFLFSARRFAPAVREMAERDERFVLVDMNEL
ncbi:MAG: ATP-binding protein [Roseburia sp.]